MPAHMQPHPTDPRFVWDANHQKYILDPRLGPNQISIADAMAGFQQTAAAQQAKSEELIVSAGALFSAPPPPASVSPGAPTTPAPFFQSPAGIDPGVIPARGAMFLEDPVSNAAPFRLFNPAAAPAGLKAVRDASGLGSGLLWKGAALVLLVWIIRG